MIRGHSEGVHPWKHLETNFEILRAYYVEGRDDDPAGRELANRNIAAAAGEASQRMLARMGVRNPQIEKDDVTGSFFIAMLSGGLARCKGGPLHVFLYAALKFLCLAVWRKESKVRFLPEEFDELDGEPGPLDVLLLGEIARVGEEMRKSLTEKRRVAIENWMDRKSTRQRHRNDDRLEGRRQSSLVFHACARLRGQFDHYRHLLG